ncbi:MAG: hypothetical protein GY714_16765 [Desulfobacterales bacterium]|nr:hypothetical protein [Desulfobacterales bacterium]
MKIKNPDIIQKTDDPKKKISKESIQGGAFNKIFQDSIKKGDSSDQIRSSALREPAATNFINFQNMDSPLKVIVDKNINLLAKYTDLIGNPDKTLKEIEPLLLKLIKDIEETQNSFKDESKKSPELFNILENILMTARKEQIKMASGSYN